MEHHLKLDQLPESVVFPDSFRDRITFEPDKRRLKYRGFMSKHAFDTLAALSRDRDYQRALEQLFVLGPEDPADTLPRTPWRRLVWAAGAILLASLLAATTFFVLFDGGNTQDTDTEQKDHTAEYVTNTAEPNLVTVEEPEVRR
jgi:hypothetical protein